MKERGSSKDAQEKELPHPQTLFTWVNQKKTQQNSPITFSRVWLNLPLTTGA